MRSWEDQTCGIVILVAAGGEQVGKSENEAGLRRAAFGVPLGDGENRGARSMTSSEESKGA